MDEGLDMGDMFYIVILFIIFEDISVILYEKLVELGL